MQTIQKYVFKSQNAAEFAGYFRAREENTAS